MEEFKTILSDEYYDWFGQYLVMKRSSIEPNFHGLYMSFIDLVNNPRLLQAVLRETYRNIKVCTSTVKWSDLVYSH